MCNEFFLTDKIFQYIKDLPCHPIDTLTYSVTIYKIFLLYFQDSMTHTTEDMC